jgi:hypothetical protein
VEPTQYSFTTGAGKRRSDPRAAVAALGRGGDAQAVGASVGARSLTALSWRCVRAPHVGSICHMESRNIVFGRLCDWRGAFKMTWHEQCSCHVTLCLVPCSETLGTFHATSGSGRNVPALCVLDSLELP